MSLKVSWRQALAWRMERHLLNPIGALPVAGVVRRLCGVQAQVASSAELAVVFGEPQAPVGADRGTPWAAAGRGDVELPSSTARLSRGGGHSNRLAQDEPEEK
jgi:hypothetical protein